MTRGSRRPSRVPRRWRRGEAYAVSAILLTTLIAIGGIVGLTAFRDQIVQELGDFSTALTHLDQSYSNASGVYMDDGPLFDDPVNAAPATLDLGS